jgi:hypothetical protein
VNKDTPVQPRPSIAPGGHSRDVVDEDLVDFLERHELGPCPDCPLELVLDHLAAS